MTDTKARARVPRSAPAETLATSELPPAVLAPALIARTAARARLQVAQTTLERAQRVASESGAEAEQHAGAQRAADRVHAAALENWIAGGCSGPRPERVVDQALAKAEATARAEHDASSAALASLQAAHDRAQAELAEAEERTRSAVTDVVLAEAERIANEIVELEERAVELRFTLVATLDHQLVRKRHDTQGGMSRAISRALYRPTVAPGSGIYLPRYADELAQFNPNGGALARQRVRECVDELLNGAEGATTTDAPRAA